MRFGFRANQLQHDLEESALAEKLRRSDVFQAFALAIKSLAGVPVTIVPARHWPPCANSSGCRNPLCNEWLRSGKGCQSCRRAVAGFGEDQKKHIIECLGGLRETAYPIHINSGVVAYLCVGPVLVGGSNAVPHQAAQHGCAQKHPFSRRSLNAFRRMPVCSKRQFRAVESLVDLFSETLSSVAAKLSLSERAPVPAIVTIEAYIKEHYRNVPLLAEAAKMAGMSREHFCRIFKKSTGHTYMEYVRQVRVQEAMKRLADPLYRISEIASEAGFESLANFNHVFKKMTGQNPTEYRRQFLAPSGSHQGNP